MWNLIKYCWPSLIVAAIIFYLCCLIRGNDVPEVSIAHIDKIVHFCMYWGLSTVTLINYILIKKGRIIWSKLIIFAIAIPILYGGLIEVLQEFYFNRTGDWADWGADILGSLASIPFAIWVNKIYSKKAVL